MNPIRFSIFAATAFLMLSGLAQADIYNVGPGQTYASIGAAPLATLQPGDTVRIHYRSTPYKEKWVICRQVCIGDL